MFKLFFRIALLFYSGFTLFCQTTPHDFFDALINNKNNLKEFIDATELERSQRLGISYNGVENKFILGNDIKTEIKEQILAGSLNYEIHETKLEDNFSLIYFVIPELKDSLRFYFKNGKFISPDAYIARNWQTKESKYFIFKISEPKYFNDYCVKRLDEFTDKLLDSLEFSSDARELLQKEKLYYIFCKDE